MNDEQFYRALLKVGKKDKDALKEIYEEYIGFIYHVILDIVKNKETAEDITSDFFIKLWEKPIGYSPGKGHKGYIAAMARNMAIDHLRKYKKEELMAGMGGDDDPPDELELAADTGAGPEEEVVGALSVEQALEKLKPVYRQIITMKVLA
ncbi:MAG: sigma-70 family RNA polymerase sigma factor, partial [Lachnospiraceae bacterium]|nr:sigma-70 family RNA polymerase sigma factor [Lachnospiraceae bacterium]